MFLRLCVCVCVSVGTLVSTIQPYDETLILTEVWEVLNYSGAIYGGTLDIEKAFILNLAIFPKLH